MIDGTAAELMFSVLGDATYLRDGVLCVPWHVAIERSRWPVTIIGQLCSDHDCTAFARWVCYWPGQTRAKCTAHRDAWAHVAHHMGFELVSRAIDVATGEDDTSRRFSLLELH